MYSALISVLIGSCSPSHGLNTADDDVALVRAALESYCTSIDTWECRVRRTYSDQETKGDHSENFLAMKGKKIFFEYHSPLDSRIGRSFWFFDGQRKTGVQVLVSVPTVGYSEFKEQEFYYNDHPVWFAGLFLRAPRRVPLYECLGPDKPKNVECDVKKISPGRTELFSLSVLYAWNDTGDNFSRVTYTLEPKKDFLPKEIIVEGPDRESGGIKRLETWHVSDFTEVLDPSTSRNRWFPIKVVGKGQIGDTKWNCTYEFLDVKINHTIDDVLFSYSVPEGSQVNDHQKNTSYVQGGLATLSKGLDASAAQGASLSRDAVRLDARPRFYSTWIALVLALVSSGALIFVLLRRFAQK